MKKIVIGKHRPLNWYPNSGYECDNCENEPEFIKDTYSHSSDDGDDYHEVFCTVCGGRLDGYWQSEADAEYEARKPDSEDKQS